MQNCDNTDMGRRQAKFSCVSCRDDGHTQCKDKVDYVLKVKGNSNAREAKTCFNCGLSNHPRRKCRGQSMETVLKEFGYYDQDKRCRFHLFFCLLFFYRLGAFFDVSGLVAVSLDFAKCHL